jgi:4-carboxymuconolactone decarboxylase
MKCRNVISISLFIAAAVSASPPARAAQAGQAAQTEAEYNASLPPDVYRDSRSRMPLIKRESLDEAGKRNYDAHISPDTSSLAGLQGPGGLRLHGSADDKIGEKLGGRLKELIRLIVARETDQAFEWTVHEPVALKNKLEPSIIEVVRRRLPLTGVPEKEAAMIQLGREYFKTHKVSSATYARALKALGDKNLIDMCILMGLYTETAILLSVNDVHLPYNLPSRLPPP